MIKKLETINRTKELCKIILEKQVELDTIQNNCKHEAIVEISYINLKYGYACNEYCLFCGEKLHRYLDYKYKFCFINGDDQYLPINDKEYYLVQQLFIEIVNSNPDLTLEKVCEKICEKLKAQNIKYHLLKNPLKT